MPVSQQDFLNLHSHLVAVPLYSVIPFWNRHIHAQPPAEMIRTLSVDLPAGAFISLSAPTPSNPSGAFLRIDILDDPTTSIGTAEKILHFGNSGIPGYPAARHVAMHDKVEIDPNFQKRSLSTILFRNQIRWYQRIGIGDVHIIAAGRSGAYSWALNGFRITPDSWALLRSQIIVRLDGLLLDGAISPLVQTDTLSILSSAAPYGLWDLVVNPVMVGTLPLAYRLLAGLGWEGSFATRDPVCLRQLNDYLLTKGLAPC